MSARRRLIMKQSIVFECLFLYPVLVSFEPPHRKWEVCPLLAIARLHILLCFLGLFETDSGD